jgi:short-chain fatty acids transporter
MIARLGSALSRWSGRWVPDPFVLAIGLTLVVIAAGAIFQVSTVFLVPDAPHDGIFWTLGGGWAAGFSSKGGLAFALQMCLVLVTGHAIAMSPPVQRRIEALAQVPKSSAAAAVFVAMVACLAALIHWGLGAIAGALLAREIGRHAEARGVRLHYPLLGAAAYSGMAVWHGGLSGSAPLKVAEKGHFAEGAIGVVPMSDTTFGAMNLVITLSTVAVILVLFWVLSPKDEADLVPPRLDELPPLPERDHVDIDSPVAWLQESRWVGGLIGVAGLAFVIGALVVGRMKFQINTVNMLFLFIGITLQGGLRHYVEAIANGARSAGAIVLQFPFYFAILGVMKASGLMAALSDGLVAASTKSSFPLFAFLSAGALNLFVPSGGGQWGVQGPILVGAGGELGVDPSATIMAFSYGDAWTNMLQPFWALPLLGIMGLKARDIIGYTAVIFLALGISIPILLLALS